LTTSTRALERADSFSFSDFGEEVKGVGGCGKQVTGLRWLCGDEQERHGFSGTCARLAHLHS
jgi:hypothetical protein